MFKCASFKATATVYAVLLALCAANVYWQVQILRSDRKMFAELRGTHDR